ncbi:MAG: hypothetical protein U9O24_04795, partial [Campylobacterota bacterium]|nr:hypothetical protein [Campylobacterota bacterium]
DFNITSKDALPLTILSANHAQMYLQNLIALLIEDNEEQCKISIILKEQIPNRLNLTLKSNGYGMPQQQLTDYLTTKTAPKKYLLVQEAQKSIIRGMGTISLYSQLGDGIDIELTFKSVNL